jgi:hypothetical protein
MTSHRGLPPGRKARVRPAHVVGLFLFYAVLTFCVLAFTFFFVYTGLEFWLVLVLTALVGGIATWVHVKAGRRTRIDVLIDRGP